MGINLGSLAPEPQVSIKTETPPITPEPVVLPDGVQKMDKGDGKISLNLSKGISLDLTKTMPALKKAKVGLGWDSVADLDVFAFGLRGGHLMSGSDVAFFNQKDAIKGIHLSGDCRNGLDSTGVDDETVEIDFDMIPAEITEIAIFANIYNGVNQNFGMVNGAYIRIVDSATNKEEAIYVLNEKDAALFNAFHFATFKRNSNGGWSFDTISKGLNGDINAIANMY